VQYVDVPGVRIAYERIGSGPPVLLLHGGLADHREWAAAQLELADEFTVITWDAPGCGESADAPEPFRMADYADTLAALVKALSIDRPCVVGLSFGATLALELAHRHPSLPRALVLASAYAGWAGSLAPDEVAERLASALDALERSPIELTQSFVETLLSDGAPPAMVETLSAMTAEFRPLGARTMVRAMAECDLRPALPTISMPTLLLHGELDVRSPLRAAEEMHAAIPGSSLTVLPGAGHQLNFEAADAFTAEVRAFLRSLPRG